MTLETAETPEFFASALRSPATFKHRPAGHPSADDLDFEVLSG
jgi:hypothetical protein